MNRHMISISINLGKLISFTCAPAFVPQPIGVMIVTASLPIGANVFLFAQRYDVAQDQITASMAVSTVLGLATITLVMSLVALLG